MQVRCMAKCLAGFVVVSVMLAASAAWAVLPPQVYQDRIRSSQVKKMAVIQEVVLDSTNEHLSRVVVAFKPLGGGETFSGKCATFDRTWQKMLMGGEVYYQPVPGQRVYVTIDMPGGSITSLSPLTSDLKYAIENAPEKLFFGMGKVYPAKPKQ